MEIKREKFVELQREVEMKQSQMLDSSSLYLWEYQMDASVAIVLTILNEFKKRLEILSCPSHRYQSRLKP